MKRYLLLLMCVLNSIWASAQFSGSGNGTSSDPYLIYNATQLYQMNNFLNQSGVVFKLMADIDLSDFIAENFNDEGWTPIGSESTPFKGKFLGNYHKISSLSINKSNGDYIGFWGYTEDAIISDLTLECQDISGKSYVGCLIGYSSSSVIKNCSISNKEISVVDYNGGGILGYGEETTLKDCSYKGKIKGNSYIGGIVGSFTGTISNIKSKADVTGTEVVGGCVGFSGKGSSITNVQVLADVSGTYCVGGCIGQSYYTNIGSCYHKGNIKNSNKEYTGGIIGLATGIDKIEKCCHWGQIIGNDYVGGIIGGNNVSLLNNIERPLYYTSGYKNGSTCVIKSYYSELVTRKTGKIEFVINYCTVSGNIIGSNYVGGIVGHLGGEYCSGYDINYIVEKDTYEPGYIVMSEYRDGSTYVYGLYRNYNNRKTCVVQDYKCYNYCKVSDYMNITSIYTIISNCLYTGNIQGTNCIGGISGYLGYSSTERNIVNLGNIKGSSMVGGIIGKTTKESNATNNIAICENISSSDNKVGRILGTDTVNVTNGNMALIKTKVFNQGVLQTIKDDAQQGQSIGTSILMLKATYVAKGWDMENVWNILETESYPYLAYQTAPPIVTSKLVSGAKTITGSSLKGGKVYMIYKDQAPIETTCNGNTWTFTTEPLQAGASIQFYAEADDMVPSYLTTATVGYNGSGTEADPYLVYTAEDLQGAYQKGYFKLMNDIDLTNWIKENSPTKGWLPIGQNTGDASNFNGDGHKITGLWTNTTDDNVGLFSNFSSGTIKNLTVEVAKGKKVKGGNYTGIIIGRNMNGTLLNCTAKGDVEGTLNVGGVIGSSKNNTLNNLTFEGTVTSETDEANIGGIVGDDASSTIVSVHAYPTINASSKNAKVGGIVGNTTGGTLTKSSAQCNVSVTGDNAQVGGVAGYSESAITLSCSTGDVSATGSKSYTGGIVGYAKDTINNCYSTTKLTGTLYTGGICAYTISKIDKCYTRGDISGGRYGGGIVAQLDGTAASVTNCIAANNILNLSDQSSWGCRVVGGFKNGAAEPDNSNFALNTMQVSINNVPQKKSDNPVEGIAKSAEVLQQAQTYMDLGWDFEKDWAIDEGYPYLLWEADVNPVTEISFDKSSLVISQGKTATIEATVMPMSATNKRLEWKSDNEKVATVNNNGEVTAVGIGTAHITATATDGSKIEATCEVNVVANRDEAIAQLQALVDNAQKLYDNSVEGENIGEYQTGARAELLAVINNVKKQISNTMEDDAIASCTETINNAVTTFKSKCVTAGEDTDISLYPNIVYLEPAEAAAGSQVTLSLKMNNTVPMTGFQCDIYFPEKTEVAKDEDGFNKIELSTARTTAKKTDYFNSAKQKTGAMRILCSSTRSYTFSGNEGEVATITLDIDKDIEEGEYPIIMKTIVLSDANAKAYEVDYVKTTLKISSYTLGDVNNDGKINVSDFGAMANYLMGNPGEVFIEKAADVNGDGSVNVSDMTAEANLILYGSIQKPQASMSVGNETTSLPVLAANVTKGSTQKEYQLTLALDNQGMQYSGFQFDLQLPKGIEVKKNTSNGYQVCLNETRQAANAIFMSNMIAENTFRVLGASASGDTYRGNEGNFVTITLVAKDDVATENSHISIDNIILAKDGQGVSPLAVTAYLPIGETTSINNAGTDKLVNVYDLKGICLKTNVTMQKALMGLPKGVYIINGKKVVK